MIRHFLHILELSPTELDRIIHRAETIKKHRLLLDALSNLCLILVFEKPSTRTRISFEVAVHELGGYTLFMTPNESQLGRQEPLKDTSRVLSRYGHGLVVRTFDQANLEELARYATVPVINALSDRFHPCQVMSDLLTVFERTPDFSRLKIAWIGDGNNMAHSWINAACLLPFTLSLATPKGYGPQEALLEQALQKGARIEVETDPRDAVKGADYVNTDVWASMGQEAEQDSRTDAFRPYQINEELLQNAPAEARVMHCLPAHRGEEISEAVIEGPRSIVWDQAENRLHMQKAILEWIAQEAKGEDIERHQ
jgi:ornithine carbamoyltransferase